MAKAAVKVQARMRKFLYEGRISSVQESNSLRFPVDDSLLEIHVRNYSLKNDWLSEMITI
jgi:hypothetical protein